MANRKSVNPSADILKEADDPAQPERFIDMAREVEADEDPEHFRSLADKELGSIAHHKPVRKGGDR